MKYPPELVEKITADIALGPRAIAEKYELSERSVIAKLSSLGLYKKKPYVNKRGEHPIKKEEYVEKIAKLLNTDICMLESLEKTNKNVLKMIVEALEE